MPGPRKLSDFKTEHFKFYRVEINQDPRNIPATLRGQFEKAGEQRRHRVVLLTFFGNPVRKNQEPFRNKVTHLDWYKLAGAHEPNRTAGVINQFGKDVLVLGDPELLLAPALKQEGDQPKPADLPKDVSHFKGYRVLRHRPFETRTVALQDQFDKEPVKFKVAAIEQHVAQFFAGALHTGLGPREREPQPLAHFLLRQPIEGRHHQGFAIRVRQLLDHRPQAARQLPLCLVLFVRRRRQL